MKRLSFVLLFELLILAAILIATRHDCPPASGTCAARADGRSGSGGS